MLMLTQLKNLDCPLTKTIRISIKRSLSTFISSKLATFLTEFYQDFGYITFPVVSRTVFIETTNTSKDYFYHHV